MRMSPQRREAIADYKRVRKNSLAKLRRLRAKGINTKSIEPRSVQYRPDFDNLKQIRAATRELQGFNSRQNSYYASRSGSPIEGQLVKRYYDARKRAEKLSAKWWGDYAQTPVITSSGQSQEYTALDRLIQTQRGGPFARQRKKFLREPSSMTRSEMIKLTEQFENMLTPEYEQNRANQLRTNLIGAIYGVDKELAELVNSLNNDQINTLYDFSDAFDRLAEYYKTLIYNSITSEDMDIEDMQLEAFDDYDREMQEQISSLRDRITRMIGQVR